MRASDVLTSSLIAVLVLLVAGCAGPPPEQSPPPPMASAEASAPAPTPDLAGAPPPAEATPAPAQGQNDYTASMAPVPNPEDLSAADRARIYGHRYDREAVSQAEPAAPAAPLRHHHHRRYARNTHVWALNAAAHHRRLHHEPAQTADLGRQAHAALKPGLGAAPVAPAKAAPASASDRLAQLQSALSGPVADGAGFVVADDLAAGKPGTVTLSLPADLYARIRSEAAKAGLGRDARRLDITATLTGDGYAITPTGPQVAEAPAAGAPAGPAPSFVWQVQPEAGVPGGSLKATIIAQLRGAGATQALPLLSLQRPVKPAAEAEAPPAAGADLFNLHLGDVDLPGLGKVPVSSILAVILLILVVVILVAAARHTAERERTERRRARAAARAALMAEEDAAASAEARHAAEPTVVVHAPEKRPEPV